LTGIIYLIIYYFSRKYIWFLIAAIISGGGFTSLGFGGPLEQSLPAEKSNNENRTLALCLARALTVGGYLMERVSASFPVYVGATMFFVEAFYYYFTFRDSKTPEEKTLGSALPIIKNAHAFSALIFSKIRFTPSQPPYCFALTTAKACSASRCST